MLFWINEMEFQKFLELNFEQIIQITSTSKMKSRRKLDVEPTIFVSIVQRLYS